MNISYFQISSLIISILKISVILVARWMLYIHEMKMQWQLLKKTNLLHILVLI